MSCDVQKKVDALDALLGIKGIIDNAGVYGLIQAKRDILIAKWASDSAKAKAPKLKQKHTPVSDGLSSYDPTKSREIPADILDAQNEIAILTEEKYKYTPRSGNAAGADKAFTGSNKAATKAKDGTIEVEGINGTTKKVVVGSKIALSDKFTQDTSIGEC